MTDFDNHQYVFYVFECLDSNVTDCYVGSTKAFRQRRAYHKKICNDDKYKGHNSKKYKMIRQHGGWDNWVMKPIDIKTCSKLEARIHENKLIDERKATLNCNKAYTSIEDKKAYHANYNKNFYTLKKLKEQKEKEELLAKIQQDISENTVVDLGQLCWSHKK